ncbi:hypothetical protein BV898_17784 [Hypsibius exemplaris]|uniref:Uncharacterized protein n=1 Tax=Hypsibius exemplaris TaxID=2072580 RepID=A0A9X6NMV8_HYPEX|nr:hypothetical protein BV898_17784 [Hypsibius exemplaris]
MDKSFQGLVLCSCVLIILSLELSTSTVDGATSTVDGATPSANGATPTTSTTRAPADTLLRNINRHQGSIQNSVWTQVIYPLATPKSTNWPTFCGCSLRSIMCCDWWKR